MLPIIHDGKFFSVCWKYYGSHKLRNICNVRLFFLNALDKEERRVLNHCCKLAVTDGTLYRILYYLISMLLRK